MVPGATFRHARFQAVHLLFRVRSLSRAVSHRQGRRLRALQENSVRQPPARLAGPSHSSLVWRAGDLRRVPVRTTNERRRQVVVSAWLHSSIAVAVTATLSFALTAADVCAQTS